MRSAALAAFATMMVAGSSIAQPNPLLDLCTHWFGRICTVETVQRTGWTETFQRYAAGPEAGPQPEGGPKLVDVGFITNLVTGEEVDFLISARTSAGDLALVGIVDFVNLVNANPGALDLSGLRDACQGNSESKECKDRIAMELRKLPREALEKAALWGHGCQSANDSVFRQLKSVKIQDPGSFRGMIPSRYVLGALVEGGNSTANILLRVTHQTRAGPVSETVCGRSYKGRLSLDRGSYNREKVGSIHVDRLGTFVGSSLVTDGYYELSDSTVGAQADVLYTGNVKECILPPRDNGPARPGTPEPPIQ